MAGARDPTVSTPRAGDVDRTVSDAPAFDARTVVIRWDAPTQDGLLLDAPAAAFDAGWEAVPAHKTVLSACVARPEQRPDSELVPAPPAPPRAVAEPEERTPAATPRSRASERALVPAARRRPSPPPAASRVPLLLGIVLGIVTPGVAALGALLAAGAHGEDASSVSAAHRPAPTSAEPTGASDPGRALSALATAVAMPPIADPADPLGAVVTPQPARSAPRRLHAAASRKHRAARPIAAARCADGLAAR
jgi:hypothetical protein